MLNKIFQNNIILALLLITGSTMAQQVYLGLGGGTAFFDEYVNTYNKNSLNNSIYPKIAEPMIESGVWFDLYRQRVKLDVGLTYKKYKINTAFYSRNTSVPTTYNLSYIGFKIGLNVAVIRWRRIKLLLHSHFSYDFLTFGTNRYRDVFTDLYKEKTLNRTMLSFHRGIGLEFKVSKNISTYLNYDLGTSFKEKNQSVQRLGEKYALETRALTIGLIFKIINYKR